MAAAHKNQALKVIVKLAFSLVLTFALMVGWVILANTFGWGAFTGWGMAHGGFVVALPACFVVATLAVFLGGHVISKRWASAQRRSQRHW